ncbi:hypothetical protein K505DRAFT_236319 [Melanomma pulvis-pyrius CBS 109.77]|uniref:Uncharacterized protein n=1 Tax=Melanomma pulvis-pyrius CBS 109.77 TaxID=1314802 RepID=A0A6A6XL02_9PLEO|nr:hypothetical protein K505DRAFT_236319 [Melanomma pulvis-pyrius CBS 109.77]
MCRCVRLIRLMTGLSSASSVAIGFHFLVELLPQLIVSAIYVAVNYKLTVMIHFRDWARLAFRQQPLRVSDPEPASDQVSTCWLSLPYQYSIPMLISSGTLGWLVSQALFFQRFIWYDNDGNAVVEHYLGYSTLGVIGSIMFGVSVFGVSMALGLRKCAPGLPLGPTNSFIIAAACHPPENDRNSARSPVEWGAIQIGNDAGEQPLAQHCTITSRRVECPVEGRLYA